jgi:hypothetical protein
MWGGRASCCALRGRRMTVNLELSPEREEAELRAYLGPEFDQSHLHNYQELLDQEVEAVGDEGELYRTSRAYLYNLTAFAMTGTKMPYLQLLVDRIPSGARILDYGCGIGSDGLLLLEAGFDVEFADFANPSVDYLRWRLDHRGLSANVHDLDGHVPGGFEAAFAFDVIEHVPDAFALLGEMESRARLVEVNLLEYEAHEQELHYRLPIRRLLFHAARGQLEAYRIYYGTSHVILYGAAPAGPARRLRNLVTVGFGYTAGKTKDLLRSVRR